MLKKTNTIREMNLYRYTKTALSKITMSFKLTLIFFLIIVFNGNAQTPAGFDLIAYEGFNYTSGTSLLNTNGGAGWTSNWEQSYQQRYLKTATTGFSYTGLTTIGNKAEWASNCYGGCNDIASLKRGFPLQNEGVVYFQFISVLEASATGGTPGIRLYNSTALTGGFGASTGTKMSILDAGLANLSSSSANLNAQNLVVIRIDYNLNKTEMWINPNLTTFNYSNPTSPSATANIAPEFDSFQLFMRSGSIDEISIFKSVTTGLDRNGKTTTTSADFVNKNGSIGADDAIDLNGKKVLVVSPIAVGDFHAGGVVFWLNGSGGGLVVSVVDQSVNTTGWGCLSTDISGAAGTAIGTGVQNTADIEAGCSTAGTAADLCANLTLNTYSDWFLPSKLELLEIFNNRVSINATAVSNFGTSLGTGFYWSSTEHTNTYAFVGNFSNGNMPATNKQNHPHSVRAVRAF